jgi:hypothetical protein
MTATLEPPRQRTAPAPPAPPSPGRRHLAAEQITVAGGQLAAGVGNLVFSLVAARLLAPGAFADLSAFLALYLGIHVPAASLSAGSALSPELAARARRRVLAVGGAVGAALAIAALPLSSVLDVSPLLLLAAAAAAPTAGLIALDRGRLYGLGRRTRAIGSLLAEPAVRLTAGVALASVAGAVGGAFAVVAAGWAALAVAHLPGTHRAPAERPQPRTHPSAVMAAFLLLAVIQNQDVVLANALLGSAEAGRFAVLSTLGGAAAFASTTVPLMLLPRAGRDALRVALAVAGALGLAAVAVVAVAPHTLIGAVFGTRYADVGGLAIPYVLAMALLGVARVLVARAGNPAMLVVLGAVAAGQLALILTTGDDAQAIALSTLAASAVLTAGAAAASVPLERLRAFALRRDVLAVAGMTVFGLVIRLLATRGIWLDEATSIKQAKMSIPGMLHDLGTTDVHPPLHHFVLWVTIRALGTGELAVRLPSILAATALIPLLFVVASDVYDRRAGYAAAALATVAPFTVWYAQEARMYALFMLFAVLVVWTQLRIVRDGGRARDWIGWVLAAGALISTQYFGLLLVGAQQLVFAAALWRRGRAALLPWFGALLAVAVIIAPLVPFALGQFHANEAAGKGFQQVPSQTGGSLGAGQQAPGAYAALTNVAWAVLGYHSDGTMTALAALWPLLMLLALVLLGRGRSWRTTTIVAAAALPAIALFALGQLKPFVFEVRYFIGAVPLLLLLMARALTSWARRPAAVAVACGVIVTALAAGLADQQLNGSNPRVYDFKGALGSISQRARPGDVVVYTPPYLDTVIAYYGPGKVESRPLAHGLPRPRHGHRVFVLASFLDKPQYRAETGKALRTLQRHDRLVHFEKRPQIRIWEFR